MKKSEKQIKKRENSSKLSCLYNLNSRFSLDFLFLETKIKEIQICKVCFTLFSQNRKKNNKSREKCLSHPLSFLSIY